MLVNPVRRSLLGCALVSALSLSSTVLMPEARAQSEQTAEVVSMSLAQAVEIALVKSYSVRLARLDRKTADSQIDGAWGSVLPRLDAFTNYRRTIATPNPFAGSSAGGIFSGLNAVDWLLFHENRRQPNNAYNFSCTVPDQDGSSQTYTQDSADFPLGAYLTCQQSGLAAAGGGGGSDNPFLVENTLNAGLNLTQTLYSGAAFAAITAAEKFAALSDAQLAQINQNLVNDVAEAYYAALLAQEAVEVMQKSVERTQQTVSEITQRVERGILPKFQQLSMEVQLANLTTQLVQAQDRAQDAQDGLRFVVGLPIQQKVRLSDSLKSSEVTGVPTFSNAVDEAMENRPDLKAARLSIEVSKAAQDVTFGRFLPELKLVGNLTAVGNIPDNRTSFNVVQPTGPMGAFDPFSYSSTDRGIFDSDYWGAQAYAGLELSWNLFEGFQTKAKWDQDNLAIKKTEVQAEQLQQSVMMQVERGQRGLLSAKKRLDVQQKNVERAELNYEHAQLRVKEGVSSQLEFRDASQQLDESRFNYLQAVHDFLVAKVNYQVAVGKPPFLKKGDAN